MLRLLEPPLGGDRLVVAALEDAPPMQIATSLGSSAPLTGNSQLPRSSFLPMQIG
jgi:hypothetical protein